MGMFLEGYESKHLCSLPVTLLFAIMSAVIPSPTAFLSKSDIEKLYSHFLHLDADGNGYISRDEFLCIPAIKANPLAARLMSLFDVDNDGSISFDEFMNVLAVFSSKGAKRDKLRLAFSIYDIDRDGFISPGELFICLKQMCGNHLTDVQLQQVVDKTIRDADTDDDGRISFGEFEESVMNRNPEFIERWAFADI